MASTTSAPTRRHLFWWALAWAFTTVTFAVLLLPIFPLHLRESASAVGLLVAGLLGTVSALARARAELTGRGRPWLLLGVAGVVAITGNVWVAITGADPVTSPSLISNLTIAIALITSSCGLLAFPSARRRGAELSVMFLDGLVAGGALLLITSVLVYSKLLDGQDHTGGSARVFSLIFPVLDVLLATVAVLLVVRGARTHRPLFTLVACAFLLYAASDLSFAVRTAQGGFHFGTVYDLGWIAGYLTLGLAARLPTPVRDPSGELDGSSGAIGTTMVFSVLVGAAVVQVLFGMDSYMKGAQSVLWVVLVAAAGGRQILLTADNSSLRRGLERRVDEQTAGLRRLARQNEVLVTSVGDGVYGVDGEGRITFVNPSGALALGYSTAELVGRNAHQAFHAARPDGSAYPWEGCYIREAILTGAVARAEEDEYARKDGSVFPVEITAAAIIDDTEVRGAVVVFRDVTQRREVDRMKNEFLSIVSHELRTPLTSIRGSLGLLAGGQLGELPERATALVRVAVQNSERLTRLINDLLDIERIDAGVAPMEVMALDMRQVLGDAIRQIEGMSTSTGVHVEVAESDGWALADEDRVIQTLMNLLGNAIKFSEPGSSVRLDARCVGEEVHVRVMDSGRGIPADKIDSVFERFEQVDSSDTRQRGGTGLGLTISRQIVQRHGGRIWIESELGVGTTVTFSLPAAPVPPQAGLAVSEPTVVLVDD